MVNRQLTTSQSSQKIHFTDLQIASTFSLPTFLVANLAVQWDQIKRKICCSIEAGQILTMFPAYYVFNFLLTTLLILHLFWGYFIIKVAYKVGRVKPCHKLKTFPGDVGGRYSDRHQESVRKLQWLVLTCSWDVYLLLFMINKFLRDLRRPIGKYRNACSGVLWSQKIARLQISALKNSINTYYMKWKCKIVR